MTRLVAFQFFSENKSMGREGLFSQGLLIHSPIFAKFIRSKMRTWKSLIVQASPWYVDPCSCGLDLQELQKIFCPWTKGGTSVKSFFHCGPPSDSKVENFCSSWRSRPLEHESTHHMEAQTMKLFHVLIFDLINLAKIGLWSTLLFFFTLLMFLTLSFSIPVKKARSSFTKWHLKLFLLRVSYSKMLNV